MSLWESFKEVIQPRKFNARLQGVDQEHLRLLKTLHLLDKPAIADVTAATDKAAEFH